MKFNYEIIQYSTYVLSVILGLSGFIIYKLQNKIIYAANCPIDSRKITYTPRDFEMDDYEDIEITTKDGIKIRAFLVKKYLDAEKTEIANSTLVYFHANAGNMVINSINNSGIQINKKKGNFFFLIIIINFYILKLHKI